MMTMSCAATVAASRRMQKKLAAGNQPDFRTIPDFRKQPLGAQQGLFDQVLQIVLQAGTMKLGRVVLDGSKVKANASKHKAVS
jgi:transposase